MASTPSTPVTKSNAPARNGQSERKRSTKGVGRPGSRKSSKETLPVFDNTPLTPDQIKQQSKIIREKFEREHLLGYDPKSIQDRVTRWQDRGGGVVPTDKNGKPLKGVVPNEEPPTPPASVIFNQKKVIDQNVKEIKDRPALAVEKLRQRNPGGRPASHSPSSNGAPRKRVVSDDNWMKNAPKLRIGASGFGQRGVAAPPPRQRKQDDPIEGSEDVGADRSPKKRYPTPPGAFPEEDQSESRPESAMVQDEDEIHQDESISVRAMRTRPKRDGAKVAAPDGIARGSTPLERRTMRTPSNQKKGAKKSPNDKNSPARNASKASRRSSGLPFAGIMRDILDIAKSPSSAKKPAMPAQHAPPDRLDEWLDMIPDPFAPTPAKEGKADLDDEMRPESSEETKVESMTISNESRKLSQGSRTPKQQRSPRTSSSGTKLNSDHRTSRAGPSVKKLRDERGEPSSGLRRAGARRRGHSQSISPAPLKPESAPIRQLLSTKIRDEPPPPPAPPRRVVRQLSRNHPRLTENRMMLAEEQNASVVRHKSSRRGGSRRGKLASNADLMSVLSMPTNDNRIRPARSVRSVRKKHSTGALRTIPDVDAQPILDDFNTYELGYGQELRTLLVGVLPVLLNDALSGMEDRSSLQRDELQGDAAMKMSLTQPIIDIGIALERLRSIHSQLPVKGLKELINWAESAIHVYELYVMKWRLDWQDVVVTLATANNDDRVENSDRTPLGQEKADVGYLLKRPLVRVKYIAKTIKAIHGVDHSVRTANLSERLEQVVLDARNKVAHEKARLEDEAAASIDASRARSLQTLGLAPVTSIEPVYHVRARDCFELELRHSNGQQIDCKVEIIMRDPPSSQAVGDMLVCEMDELGRWLLFPPISLDCVSGRTGGRGNELVVMIRSNAESMGSWYELVTLRSEEESVAADWLEMIGKDPVPPAVARAPAFNCRPSTSTLVRQAAEAELDAMGLPLLTDSVVPLGAASVLEPPASTIPPYLERRPSFGIDDGLSRISEETATRILCDGLPSPTKLSPEKKAPSPRSSKIGGYFANLLGSSQKQASKEAKTQELPLEEQVNSGSAPTTPGALSPVKQRSSQEVSPERTPRQSLTSTAQLPERPRLPQMHGRGSSLPELPPQHLSAISPIPPSPLRHEASTVPPTPLLADPSPPRTPRHLSPERKPMRASLPSQRPAAHEPAPQPPPHRIQRPHSASLPLKPAPILPPPPITHDRKASSPLKHEYAPSSDSYTDDSSSFSSDLDTDDEQTLSSSETSEDEADEDLDAGDAPTHLLPIGGTKRLAQLAQIKPPGSVRPDDSASQAGTPNLHHGLDIPHISFKTVASLWYWSDAGAWQRLHKEECTVVVTAGLIEAFELPEAPPPPPHGTHSLPTTPPHLTPNSSRPSSSHHPRPLPPTLQRMLTPSENPLIGLELTPLVPLRRGTLLDISVRSPPTPRSRILKSNNIMFRTCTPTDCEALYQALNQARIYNPTYIALQNAMPRHQPLPVLERKEGRKVGFWGWSGRRNSYRAKGRAAPASLSSRSSGAGGGIGSAFTALKRLSGNAARSAGGFDVARSEIHHVSTPGSIYTSSSDSSRPRPGGATAGASTTSGAASTGGLMGPAATAGETLGLNAAKIHLYRRETASKWRDMGSCRLSILAAEPSLNPFTNHLEPLRRIYITAKRRRRRDSLAAAGGLLAKIPDSDEVILDVSLPEQCFERVARTGIALSVWEGNEGGRVKDRGGVGGGKVVVWMVQMGGEREAAYTFGLVGKMRY